MKGILILVGLVLSFLSYAQRSWTDFNLQGEVKNVLEIQSSISKEWPTDTALFIFNEVGTLIKEIEPNTFEMRCSFSKKYDSKGNITFRKCNGTKQSTKWINTYNENDRLIKIQNPFDRQTTTFSYDKKDRLIKIEKVDSSILRGTIFFTQTINQYDEDGKLELNVIYQAENQEDSLSIISHEINIYNTAGNIVLRDEKLFPITQTDSVHSTYSVYLYHKDGSLKSLKIGQVESELGSFTTYLYEKRRLISKTTVTTYYDQKELKINKEEYLYDHFGNVTKWIDHTISQHYTYQYDERGNWIEKVIFNEGIPLIRKERSIIYFD